MPQDEVIVETADGRVAVVHMTWSGHAESPPWPTTEMLDSAEHILRQLHAVITTGQRWDPVIAASGTGLLTVAPIAALPRRLAEQCRGEPHAVELSLQFR